MRTRLALFISIVLVAPSASVAQCVDYENFPHLIGREELAFAFWSLTADANYAYGTTSDDRFIVLDVSDPLAAAPFGELALSPPGESVVLLGSHAFTAGWGNGIGLRSIDISNPATPFEADTLPFADGTQFLATHGNHLLVQRHLADVVDVVDAADPTNLQIVSSIPMDGVALLSGDDNLVYARTRTTFEIWDLTDPSAPQPRGSLPIETGGSGFESMVRRGTTLLLPLGYDIQLVDASNPDAPVLDALIPGPYNVHRLLLNGNLLYVNRGSGDVDVYDATDLSNPTWLNSMVGGAREGLALSGNRLLCTVNYRLSLFDVTNADQSYPSAGIYDWVYGFSLSAERVGDHVYVGSDAGLWALDVSDPTNPTPTFNSGRAASVVLVNGYLYENHNTGLTIYDVSTPSTPSEFTTITTSEWDARGLMEVDGDILFADGIDSLLTFDISTPTLPLRMGGRKLLTSEFAVDNAHVYALSDSALHILDRGDPVNLPLLGSVPMFRPESIAIEDGYVWACYGNLNGGTIWRVDVSDPTQPFIANTWTGIYARGLSLHGDRLLATQGGWGVQILDVSDPMDLRYAGNLFPGSETPWVYRAKVMGDLVWMGYDAGALFLPELCANQPTAVQNAPSPSPPRIRLSATPNPFNPQVLLSFELPRATRLEAAIFDLRGRRVRTLLQGAHLEAGVRKLRWDGTDDKGAGLASGVYLAKLWGDGFVGATKVTLAK